MMYHPENRVPLMKKYMAIGLEMWHSYKMATQMVYEKFALLVFAPLFHHLCPGTEFSSVKNKKKMPKVHHIFTCLRKAYNSDLRSKLNKVLGRRDQRVHMKDSQGQMLVNIRDLLEFFIPAVSNTKNNSHNSAPLDHTRRKKRDKDAI